MLMKNIPFGTSDWSQAEVTEHMGVTGKATWRTQQFGDIRVRLVEYSPGYAEPHRSFTSSGVLLFIVD